MKTKDFNSVKEARKAAIGQLEFYNRMMATKTADEELVSHRYIREQVDKDMQPFYDAFPFPQEAENMTDTKKKLFVVDTLITFRNRYVVEAESLEHAYDEVTMLDSGDDEDYFEPFSAKSLPEQILDGKEISKKKFQKMLTELAETGEGSHWMGEKLIRKIDYDR